MTNLAYSYYYQNYLENFSIDHQQIQDFCQNYNQAQSIENRQIKLTTIQGVLKDFQDKQPVYLAILQQVIKQDFLLTNIQLSDWQRLVIMVVCLQPLINLYKRNSLPLKVLRETLSDLFLRVNLSQGVGLSADDFEWLARIFRLRIFKLGELQFEFTNFNSATLPEDISYINNGYKILKDNLPIISVHIMQNSLIDKKHSLSSFDQAIQFKQEFLAEFNYNYFYCHSWLLNPNNNSLLDADSKILSFAKNFELLAYSSCPKMAIERIFGTKELSLKNLPQQTSLQRKAIINLKLLGVGIGIKKFGNTSVS
ncbi:hypothetical protein [Facklamia sp. 7083-14-GEN3]|uniref:hypothetical protein n=1 Tax=Facklamia sp. 7083-14-GEN3 TaxID=2973478 RepID=UPI00215B8912|nr:hypothetical protein [Facklamia sp. 7083-14-GEN3]MCR8969377.1 hypothetical protein [Facklamia sp. 7083-14-GEN3]